MVSISAQAVVIDIIAQVTDKTSEGIEKAKSGIDKLGQKLKKTQNQVDKLGNSKSELSIKDKATQVIQKVSKGLKNVSQKVWKITVKVLDKATAPIRGIFNLIKNPLVLTVSILGASVGIKDTINTFASFESTMSKVKAISGATADDMKVLTAKAKEMGATTKFTATEAGEAFSYMAMAGWKTNEMLGAIEGVMNLAASSGEELGTVSDILTDAMTAFGLSASGTVQIELADGSMKEVANATHFADVLAAAASNSNTNVALLGESFKYCAPLAGQFKFSVEDTALALGLMANSGIKASNSGTAMRKMLTQLSSDFEVLQSNGSKVTVKTINDDGSMRNLKDILDDTRDAFKGMSQAEREALQNDLSGTANSLGIALSKENGALKTQAELYDEVMQAAQTMTDAGRVAEAEALAGKTAMAGLLSIVGASDEDYNKLADAVYNADGTAAKMAAIMMDNLEGDFILFQSAAEGVQIAFTEKLNPHLRSFVKWITAKMPDVSRTMEKVAEKIGNTISNVQKKIQEFTSGDAWKNADFFGKVSIAWDELILQPFSNWWSGTGKAWFAQKAGEIGNGLGKGITFGFMALLGMHPQGAIEDGISIGASFAEGFAKGFDGKKVIKAILEGIKNIGKDAATLLPGGEKASSTAWLSTGLLAYGGMKTGKGIASIGNFMSTVTTGTGLLGSAGAGTGLLGLGSNTAIALGAGNLAGGTSLSVGALSAVGLSSIAGGILGMAGLADAVKDFTKGNTERGLAKTGMAGGGAAIGATIGTLIFPGLGTLAGGLIGSGIGGIGALLKGDTVGDWFHETFTKKGREEKEKRELEQQEAVKQAEKQAEKEEKIRKEKERQLAIEKQINRLKDTKLEINNTREQIFATNQLKNTWSEIHKELESGLLTEEEKVKKQEELKDIVSQLSELYPELIDASDSENGKLDEKLEKIQNMNELERERQKLLLENLLIDASRNLDGILNDLNVSNENLDRLRERQQMLKEKRMDFESDVSELGVLEQELIRAKNTGEAPVVIQKYEDQVQNQEQKMEKNLQNIGIEISYDEIFEMIPMDTEFSSKDIHHFSYTKENVTRMLEDEQKRNNSNQELEIQNNQKLQDQLQEIYDAELQLMELELNMPIEEAAKSYETMGETQKKVFDKILDDLFNLNSEFQNFVDQPKHMDILLNFIPEKAKLLEENKEHSINNSGNEVAEPVTLHAMGGILTRPHIGMVAEAGAEAILPLTGRNKERGKTLWEQAGRILGMFPDEKIYAHAQGGIFGDVSKNRALQSPVYDSFFSDEEETESKKTPSNILVPIEIGGIHLGGMNFTFDGVGNGDRESIMRMIREQMPEIAEEVADTIAAALTKLFSNLKAETV